MLTDPISHVPKRKQRYNTRSHGTGTYYPAKMKRAATQIKSGRRGEYWEWRAGEAEDKDRMAWR